MNRARVVRALLALAVLALTSYYAVTSRPQLGLDLRGGTQIVLETKDSPTTRADPEATDRALEVLRRRVDALGVSEPTLARSGGNRIIVELPGVDDPAAAQEAVGRTAQLTFHPVLEALEPDPADPPTPEPPPAFDATKEQRIDDETGLPLRVGPAALTGEGVGDASAQLDPQFGTSRFVAVEFRGDGGRSWERLTGQAACSPAGDAQRRVAIVLDGAVVSSPQVSPEVACDVGIVGGSTQITGDYTQAEAEDLAALVKGGALPVPVEVVSRSVIGPTLGAEAITSSLRAGAIGLGLTAVFLVVVYRLVGLLAAVALVTYGVISYGTLVALGATLTLPGLGGLLLSAGLAIDANVLVFERAREEYAGQRTRRLGLAVDNGFRRAFAAIADSNVTTLLAAGLLFLLAAGPVRGFGVTLTVGVLASVVSALLVTRVLTDLVIRTRLLERHPQWSGLSGLGRFRGWLERRRPRLMRYRRRWLAVSAVAVLVALAGIGVRGLNLGIEFTGGRVVQYATTTPVSVADARAAVADAGFPQAVVQESGERDLAVRTSRISDAEEQRVRASLAERGGPTRVVGDDLVGPTLGEELRNKALLAFVIALGAQLAYLAVRFRWTFAAGAVLAMLHDVLIVLGVFAWLGKPVDGVFLAAALTIIGVSVNDSIVTLDRVRETWARGRTRPLADVVDEAVVATAPRTVNTGIGAMFILGALTLLGGESLTDFALALLLGLLVGTYSSAFTAAPLLLLLERFSSAPAPMPPRQAAAARRRTGARPVPQR